MAEKKCVVCGKAVPESAGITKNERVFCCADCVAHFEDENKPDAKGDVCEFC